MNDPFVGALSRIFSAGRTTYKTYELLGACVRSEGRIREAMQETRRGGENVEDLERAHHEIVAFAEEVAARAESRKRTSVDGALGQIRAMQDELSRQLMASRS